MKLYDGAGSFDVAIQKRITPKLKNLFTQTYAKMKTDPKQDEWLQAVQGQKFDIKEGEKVSISGALAMQLAAIKNKPADVKTVMNNMTVNIECMKIIIDRTGLTPEQSSLLDKPDFWENQDIKDIEREVSSFRDVLES
jgi:hypothetical protein